jgi:hypothetical protein
MPPASYMVDLKSEPFLEDKLVTRNLMLTRGRNTRCRGKLRAGDAFGHREDGHPALFDRGIPAVLSIAPQTHLLLP